MVQMPIRIDDATAKKIDAYGAQLEKQTPGLSLSRSEVIRILLTRGIEAVGMASDKPKK